LADSPAWSRSEHLQLRRIIEKSSVQRSYAVCVHAIMNLLEAKLVSQILMAWGISTALQRLDNRATMKQNLEYQKQ